VAHCGQPATFAAAYTKASQFVGLPPEATLLPQPAVQLGAVRTAMLRLNQLLPMQKQTLIKACMQCVMSDGRVDALEADILRAVCASLDVPLPQPIS
jgi:DNA-binding Xre family transcriptional regulator